MPKSYKPRFNSIIFDIGDVLFTWSPLTKTSISPYTIRKIISSATWFDYECGLFSQADCYDRVAKEFSLDVTELGKAFQEARESLRPNEGFITFIRELKVQSNGQLRIFAMSNISAPDYAFLLTRTADWSIFENVFTSCTVGERKPNLGFYKQVIALAKIDPSHSIFVDDKPDNVLSACSFGFHGIVFEDMKEVTRILRNLLGDAVKRGQQFLHLHAGHLESVADNGTVIDENFAQLLIYDTMKDRSLVNLSDHTGAWNFFRGKGLLTTEEFPFDLDTTSLALTITRQDSNTVISIMDEMLNYIDADGIVQTYFDHRRPRFDPVVCVNVLTLFHSYGRGDELQPTLNWVMEVLLHRAYLNGTRYYATAESFLFFLSRLIHASDSSDLQNLLRPLLHERLQERIGLAGDALTLGMRIIACQALGIRDHVDLTELRSMQDEDGGWGIGWIYKYGASGIKIGNRGLTTAFAIKAISCMD